MCSTALVLAAHGSRYAAANAEVLALARAVARRTKQELSGVVVGFLELAQPDIMTALAQAAAMPVRYVWVFPYFLAGGTHVSEELPQLVQRAAQRYAPEQHVRLLPYLGQAAGLAELIASALPSVPNTPTKLEQA